MPQNRLEDNPVIKQMASDIKTILKKQEGIERMLLDPDNGVYSRIRSLEHWREIVDSERITRKKKWERIIWIIVGALLTGGSILGYSLQFVQK